MKTKEYWVICNLAVDDQFSKKFAKQWETVFSHNWYVFLPLSFSLQSVRSSSSKTAQPWPIKDKPSAVTRMQLSILSARSPLQRVAMASIVTSVISRQHVMSSFCRLVQEDTMLVTPASVTPWHLLRLSSFSSLHPLPIRLKSALPMLHPSSLISCRFFSFWRLEKSKLLTCHQK